MSSGRSRHHRRPACKKPTRKALPYLEPAKVELLQQKFMSVTLDLLAPEYLPGLPVPAELQKQTSEGFLYYLMVVNKELELVALSRFRIRKAQHDAARLQSLLDVAFRQALAAHVDTQELLEDSVYMNGIYAELTSTAAPYVYLTTDPEQMLLQPKYRPVLVVYVCTFKGRPVPWVATQGFLHS